MHEYPSYGDIRRALPPHVFQPSVTKSLLYVLRSVVFITVLAVSHWLLRSLDVSTGVAAAFSVCYWFLQGVVFWGVFTLGHDCGHSSFSLHPALNWVVGALLHTFILVPYQSWRISHRHHHQNTGHIDNDEIFFPHRSSQDRKIVRAGAGYLGLAWQMYLMWGFGPRYVYHYNPFDKLFKEHRSEMLVGVSVVMYAAWMSAVAYAVSVYGMWLVADMFLLPIFVAGSWLTITTFLHHNEPETPWYSDSEWTFVRGALSSVDRDYFPFNSVIHDIGTHQLHHLFPAIPHYYLQDATKAFRAQWPQLVRTSDTPILRAFWNNLRAYIENGVVDESVTMFCYDKDGNGHVLKTKDSKLEAKKSR